jgi:hypothetical protein
MNKELIKKYWKEFKHWVNGGSVYFQDKHSEWKEIHNDGRQFKFRKALAEGKTVQSSSEEDGWVVKVGRTFSRPVSCYRIKPDKPKISCTETPAVGDLLYGGKRFTSDGIAEWFDFPRYRVIAIHMNGVDMFIDTLNSEGKVISTTPTIINVGSNQWMATKPDEPEFKVGDYLVNDDSSDGIFIATVKSSDYYRKRCRLWTLEEADDDEDVCYIDTIVSSSYYHEGFERMNVIKAKVAKGMKTQDVFVPYIGQSPEQLRVEK